MKLPIRRERTFAALSQIPAADLNAFQDAHVHYPLFVLHQNWTAPMYAAWTDTIAGTAAIDRVVGDGSNGIAGPWCRFRVQLPGTPDKAIKESETVIDAPWPAAMAAALEFRVNALGMAGEDAKCHIGLINQPGTIGTTEDFIKLEATQASPNWVFRTGSTAGVSTDTNTGVAIDDTVKVRIEVYGSDDPDGARALCYIDDALVATHTTNLPTGDTLKIAVGLFAITSASTLDVYVSPMTYRAVMI